MKRPFFLEDTIARRLVVTVTLAAAVTLILLELFFTFGGKWAKPDIQEAGVVSQVGAVIRIVGAAPAADREHLAQAANTDEVHFAWYAPGSPQAQVLQNGHYSPHAVSEGWRFLRPYLRQHPERMVVFQENNPVSRTAGLPYDRSRFDDAYFAGLQLDDGSWILCVALQRFWGLYAFERFCLQFLMFSLWVIAVSLIASRQLSCPIEHLADGVRSLGLQPRSARLEQDGPREIRLVAETINGMQAQIQQFIEYRTTMLAAISHDLRTPLTRIRLRGEFIDCPEQQKNLFRDVDEMQAMIDGALSFFRNDASREDSIMFDLPGLLQTIANDYCDQGFPVEYHGPAKAGYVGQLYAMKRVFSNLVENAIKYATPPTVTLETQDDGSYMVFIRDNGPGIPENSLSEVFEPYFRLDKSRNRQTGGVGLGLTSAQTIVRSNGGDITMVNRPEGGLEVRIHLPKIR
ncbi:ATP-binding protein [Gluconobacter oxydans]|uniref:ATP-binding protein n=1 Tax=Gluconobacter oxydans TaxID=442 RepID=UPI001CD91291|nr:ATP-binding protein [Gluconobacter oxydans]